MHSMEVATFRKHSQPTNIISGILCTQDFHVFQDFWKTERKPIFFFHKHPFFVLSGNIESSHSELPCSAGKRKFIAQTKDKFFVLFLKITGYPGDGMKEFEIWECEGIWDSTISLLVGGNLLHSIFSGTYVHIYQLNIPSF